MIWIALKEKGQIICPMKDCKCGDPFEYSREDGLWGEIMIGILDSNLSPAALSLRY